MLLSLPLLLLLLPHASLSLTITIPTCASQNYHSAALTCSNQTPPATLCSNEQLSSPSSLTGCSLSSTSSPKFLWTSSLCDGNGHFAVPATDLQGAPVCISNAASVHGVACCALSTPPPPPPRPNIILYIADDLGFGEVLANTSLFFPFDPEHPQVQPNRSPDPARVILTPNITRLALQSKRLFRMYSPSSVCAPSRASMFSGRNVGQNTIRNNWNQKLLPNYVQLNEPIPAFSSTLQAEADYDTLYLGKWGLGATVGSPAKHGFANFFGYLTEGGDEFLLPFPLYLNEIVNGTQMPSPHFPTNMFATEQLCPEDHSPKCINSNILFRERALAFLSSRVNSSRPFLLVWAPTTPHAAGYHYKSVETSPTYNLGWREFMFPPYKCKRGHAAQVEQHIDVDIGLLLDLLEANPSLDANTLVVFTSDNGPHADCKDDLSYNPFFFLGTGGLRGWKGSMFEGGLRVPTMVRWSGHVQPGSVSKSVQTLYDLQATLLAAAGLTPAVTGGVNQLPVWLGGDEDALPRPWAHFEICAVPYVDASCSTATLDLGTSGHLFKLVWNASESPQLYDLLMDPIEANDLALQRPADVARLQRLRSEARVPARKT